MTPSRQVSTANDLNFLSNDTLNYSSIFGDSLNKENDFLTFSMPLTIVIGVIAGLMSSITIIGNVFVITAFIIEKSLRKYSNYFILNLSIADLLIGILIPPYTPFLLYKYQWKLGRIACTIWLILDYVVGSASVLCIVVISLDRYLLVSRGLKYVADQKVTKAICIMLTVWTIAFLNYAPAIVLWEFISGKRTVKDGECQVEFHDNLVYLTGTACVEFFAPLISICTLNLAVYLNIRKRSRGLIRSENPMFTIGAAKNITNNNSKNNNPTVSTTNNTTGKENIKMERLSMTEETTQHAVKFHKELNKKSNTTSVSYSTSGSDSSNSIEDMSGAKNRLNKKSKINMNKSINDEPASNENSVFLIDNEKSKTNLKKDQPQPNQTTLLESNLKNLACNSVKTITNISQTQTNNKALLLSKKSTSARTTLTKDKKAARSLFILVFVFVFCWAPYTFLTLIKAVCPTCVNEYVYEFAFWLLWFNSTVNPILYPFLHVKFRKAFIKIFKLIFFCIKFKRKKYDPNKK